MLPQITHSELPNFIDLAVSTGENLLIVGKPGLGKTVGVKSYCSKYAFDLEMSHPAVEDPTNRAGFPAKATEVVTEQLDELDAMLSDSAVVTRTEDYATFLPFGQMRRLTRTKNDTIWFLDDFGQAENAVQKGFMQYLGEGRLNDFILPRNVHIVAATNSREDKAGVKGLLEPVKSRFGLIVELVADLDSFRDYAYQNNFAHYITDFLNWTPLALHDWQPNTGMEKSPNPRLWEKLDNFFKKMEQKGVNVMSPFFHKVCCSAIGEKYGAKFAAFVKMYARLPRYEEIIADPENFEINHSADVRYGIMGMLANMGKPEHADLIFQVIRKFAKEYQVIFMRTLSAKKSPLISSGQARLWCGENSDIYLSALERSSTSF